MNIRCCWALVIGASLFFIGTVEACCSLYREEAPYLHRNLPVSDEPVPSLTALTGNLFPPGYPYEDGDYLNTHSELFYQDHYPCLSSASSASSASSTIGDESRAKLLYCYAAWRLMAQWPAAEAEILEHPLYAYLYAKNLLKRRWQEAEHVIAKDPRTAFLYARDLVQGRWPEAENTIASHPRYAFNYAAFILKERWLLGEKALLNSPRYGYLYARDVLQQPWENLEKKGLGYYQAIYEREVVNKQPVLEAEYPGYLVDKAVKARKRDRVIEVHLLDKTFHYYRESYPYHHEHLVDYAEKVIGGRWPEAEAVLLADGTFDDIQQYHARVVKAEWPEWEHWLERQVTQTGSKRFVVAAFWYAQRFKAGRWPAMESHFSQTPYAWRLYLRNL